MRSCPINSFHSPGFIWVASIFNNFQTEDVPHSGHTAADRQIYLFLAPRPNLTLRIKGLDKQLSVSQKCGHRVFSCRPLHTFFMCPILTLLPGLTQQNGRTLQLTSGRWKNCSHFWNNGVLTLRYYAPFFILSK